ncbi:MAG: hypothetical protein HFE81_05995 [Bacilli bacterium]|nr:hypothetical protein [Bacilli bacterium]
MIHINTSVFVKIVVPEIDKSYDVYLPVNKKVGNIINLLNSSISEMSSGEFPVSNNNKLYNSRTLERYASNVLLYNTTIRNGSVLILIS